MTKERYKYKMSKINPIETNNFHLMIHLAVGNIQVELFLQMVVNSIFV